MADALDAVSPDVAGRTRALLQAVATGGTAGLRAYESGQQALTQSKTDAVTRAQTRAGLIGGPEAQGFESQAVQVYDRGLGNLASARSGFEANMAQLGTAHKNYLDQVAAAVPLVRADTQRQLALRKAAVDAELAKQAERDARAAAKEDKPKASDILNLAENVSSLYGQSTLKGTVGPNGSETTGSANIPAGRNWITDDLMMTAADNAAFNGTTTDFELAKIVAEVSGLSPTETAKMLTPSSVAASSTKADKAQAPAQDPIARSLAQKYDTKGVTYDLAKSVLNNVDFQGDVEWILGGADGKTRSEVEEILRKYYLEDRNWPSEYNILMGEYANKLPTKKN